MNNRILTALILCLAMVFAASAALAYEFDTTYDLYRFHAYTENGDQLFTISRGDANVITFVNDSIVRTYGPDGSVAGEKPFAEITPGLVGMTMINCEFTNCEDLDFDCYYVTVMSLTEGWTVVATNRVLPLTATNCKDDEIVDFSAAMDVAGSNYYLCKQWLIETR